MLGIDLTKISRFKNPSQAFLKKVLHPEELTEYLDADNKPHFLAARWAIKEALYKADNSLLSFAKIRIFKKNRKYLFSGYVISTTKENDYYLAIVKKETNEV